VKGKHFYLSINQLSKLQPFQIKLATQIIKKNTLYSEFANNPHKKRINSKTKSNIGEKSIKTTKRKIV
jgi:hypothetical protein